MNTSKNHWILFNILCLDIQSQNATWATLPVGFEMAYPFVYFAQMEKMSIWVLYQLIIPFFFQPYSPLSSDPQTGFEMVGSFVEGRDP